jgi:hypothetical protein
MWTIASDMRTETRKTFWWSERRFLLMLKAYFDDSNMGQGPLAVLAGWVAPAGAWESFSDPWRDVCEMKPRIDYFKFGEALGFVGQFERFSEQSRKEKLALLVSTIADIKPLGISCALPRDLYNRVFGKNRDRVLRFPYFFCFYSVVAHLTQYLDETGSTEPVDFIFDIQPGQVTPATASWKRLLEVAPPRIQRMLGGFPLFCHDTTLRPIQAADLIAGWTSRIQSRCGATKGKTSTVWEECGTSNL